MAMAKKRMEVTWRKRVVMRGIIAPEVMVSTSRRKGMMERTLWCEEKGMNQCTTRLCAQTRRTSTLIGKIQSIRISMEWA